jgi:predicted nucleic acid-binding protein
MIVLDTNVLAELTALHPAPAVRVWLDGQKPDQLRITAITLYEAELGIQLLPTGKKRRDLEEALRRALNGPLRGRVLPFGDDAAKSAAAITVRRKQAGRPINLADALIAGIAQANSASLATRDVADFAGLDFRVVNPWEER